MIYAIKSRARSLIRASQIRSCLSLEPSVTLGLCILYILEAEDGWRKGRVLVLSVRLHGGREKTIEK